MRKSHSWMTPLCSEARIQGRFGWKERPFTRLLFVSNWGAGEQEERSEACALAPW
jgi:hypothetical protein